MFGTEFSENSKPNNSRERKGVFAKLRWVAGGASSPRGGRQHGPVDKPRPRTGAARHALPLSPRRMHQCSRSCPMPIRSARRAAGAGPRATACRKRGAPRRHTSAECAPQKALRLVQVPRSIPCSGPAPVSASYAPVLTAPALCACRTEPRRAGRRREERWCPRGRTVLIKVHIAPCQQVVLSLLVNRLDRLNKASI